MLSGRYVTDHRSRYWSKSNPDGNSQLCMMSGKPLVKGSLEHLLLSCPALSVTRSNCILHVEKYLQDKPILLPLVKFYNTSDDHLNVQFLLDPSTCPEVILAVQESGSGVLADLFYLTRTWCHSHHTKRMNLLRLYNVI